MDNGSVDTVGSESRVLSGQLRIGDVERERAATALGEHYAAGRLDRSEFDARLAAAYAAHTKSELSRLFADLPDPRPFAEPRVAAASRMPRVAGLPIVVLPLLAVLLITLTALTHGIVPLVFVGWWLLAGARRRNHRAWH